MSNGGLQESLIEGVLTAEADMARASIGLSRAAQRLETARSVFVTTKRNSRRGIFKDLAGGGTSIEGDHVFNFIEASMRIEGADPAEAANTAEELAATLTHQEGQEPLPVYIGNTIFVMGSLLEGEAQSPVFSIVPSDCGKEYLLAGQSDRLDIFVAQPRNRNRVWQDNEWSLSNKGVNWQIDNITDVNLIRDMGHRDKWRDRQIPSVFVGRAVEQRFALTRGSGFNSDSKVMQNPEIVALLALIRLSVGEQPEIPFVHEADSRAPHCYIREGRTLTDRTCERLQDFIASFEVGLPKSPDQGLPVEFHSAVLDYQGVERQLINQAIADRLCWQGCLRQSDLELIEQRVRFGTRTRVGETVDSAILARAKIVEKNLGRVGLSEALHFSSQAILDAAIQDTGIYLAAAKGRSQESDEFGSKPEINSRDEVVQRAVAAYMQKANRFTGRRP